ncbi:hypothetical protein ID866_6349 [Astraeus odoratus]|nr:hypothetical protein ID866_6349 [Astraeus odoratus]
MADRLTDHCFTTVQHTGTPTGRRIDVLVGGVPVPTYLAEPPASADTSPRRIILYFADVFGPFYVNGQLVQDYFAAHGFTVLGIDYFFGDSYALHVNEPGFDRPTWRDKAVKQAKEFTPGWVEAVKEKYGTEVVKYFAIGYCFGAPYVFDYTETGLLSAVPVLYSCGEEDHAFGPELRRAVEDALSARKMSYYFQIFSGAAHGFATRADPSVESQRFAKEECARAVVQWFNQFSV